MCSGISCVDLLVADQCLVTTVVRGMELGGVRRKEEEACSCGEEERRRK